MVVIVNISVGFLDIMMFLIVIECVMVVSYVFVKCDVLDGMIDGMINNFKVC